MTIHDHGESVEATTAQTGGAIASVAVPPRRDPMALDAFELSVFGLGFLLLGVLIGWAINEMCVARLTRQRDRMAQRWARAAERFEQAKEVIARIVTEESEGRRPRRSGAA